MKTLDCVQGSMPWLVARAGKVTASEADALVSPTFKARDGETPKTYLALKVAEAIGGPILGFSSFQTDQGTILEDEARPFLEFELNAQFQRPGLIVTDDGRCACSPDALGDGYGVEIKCPQPVNHVKWLLAGVLPPEHAVQVHFSMYVTGFKKWIFLSYRRKFPPLLITVERDESKIAVIDAAVKEFMPRMDAALERLRAM